MDKEERKKRKFPTDEEKEELLKERLQTVPMNHGTKIALLVHGYRTIGDVVKETPQTLVEIKGIGPGRLKGLQKSLSKIGLFLKKKEL
jgi:DNA-directed RNA polymerase alpha subunit